ncbi:hypothetical protein AHAS_Ahas15G0142500 [Arachis hypogaea]
MLLGICTHHVGQRKRRKKKLVGFKCRTLLTRKNKSYVNQKTKEIADKIEAHSSQQVVKLTVNSPLDALRVVFGKEHPGCI